MASSTKRPAEQEALKFELEGYQNQLEANYGSLRKANFAARSSIEDRNRCELLTLNANSDTDGDVKVRKRTLNKENMAKKASNVTEDLLAISQMMSTQVTQSEHTLSSLITSSATVTETQEEFKLMGSLLVQSRKLLFKYGRREITDKVLMFLALAFFFSCVLYVVSKRLF